MDELASLLEQLAARVRGRSAERLLLMEVGEQLMEVIKFIERSLRAEDSH